MDENPYAAPNVPIVAGEIDTRGIAARQRLLLISLESEPALLLILLVFVSIESRTRGFSSLISGLLLSAMFAAVVLFWVFWAIAAWSAWTLATRLKGGWSDRLLAVLHLFPFYAMPAGWLLSRRATRYLRSKGYEVGWFGARLSQFDERAS